MSRAKGNVAEQKACEYLQKLGYVIVEQNFYAKMGEIDIIAFKDNVYHFVEVKSGDDYEKAIQNITPSKLSKVLRTAALYLQKNYLSNDYMFDAVVVTPDTITLVENITL